MQTFSGAALTALAASLILAKPALAQDLSGDLPQVRVSYADLNLSSDDGANRLNRRVEAAIRGLCTASSFGPTPLQELSERRQCAAAARTSATPQLTAAIEQAKSGVQMAQRDVTIVRQ